MTKSERFFTTLDIYQSAFLLLCGIQPELEVHNGKVVFRFPVTDKFYESIMLFNSNTEVKVTDFVTAIKTLRGQMLTMRGNLYNKNTDKEIL